MNIKTETWLEHDIRFVEIEGEWWGIAKDIADALGYVDSQAMVRHIKSKFLQTVKLTVGKNMGNGKFTAISEQGIYKAIAKGHPIIGRPLFYLVCIQLNQRCHNLKRYITLL